MNKYEDNFIIGKFMDYSDLEWQLFSTKYKIDTFGVNSAFCGIHDDAKAVVLKELLLWVNGESTSSVSDGTTDRRRLIILDPRGKYSTMALGFGGKVIKLANLHNSDSLKLNPFDMDAFCNCGEDPLPNKCQEICALIEILAGGENALSNSEKAYVSNIAHQLFISYYKKLQDIHKNYPDITIMKENIPTFADLFSELEKSSEPEAASIIKALQDNRNEVLSLFSGTTNTPCSHIICYDLSSLSETMKQIGMRACLTNALNIILSAQSKQFNFNTHVFIEDFDILASTSACSQSVKANILAMRHNKATITAVSDDIAKICSNNVARHMLEAFDQVVSKV